MDLVQIYSIKTYIEKIKNILDFICLTSSINYDIIIHCIKILLSCPEKGNMFARIHNYNICE